MLPKAPRWNAMDGVGWRPDGVEVSIAALLELVEEAAPEVAAHMERTGRLARLLALELGLTSQMVDLVVRTARVHDVGKLTIPPWVFEKSGPLSPSERALKEAHPVTGQRILERKPALVGLGPLVRATHERWDGNGYPDGLMGSSIPLPARIVAVCDAFDAMTDRDDADSSPVACAIEELRHGAGTLYDPCVVDPFCDLMDSRVGDCAGQAGVAGPSARKRAQWWALPSFPSVDASPISPPIAPMLGRRTDTLPAGDWIYEPKWDGFRCLAFRDGGAVDLRSRHDRPLSRYFPEVVTGLNGLRSTGFVLDGEIVVAGEAGLDFDALLARVHPAASRVERLSRETPACFIAFDVIALDGDDLRDRPFHERRALLTQLVAERCPTVRVTPATQDRARAAEWLAGAGKGIDGVMAKPADLRYQPGARAMLKVKPDRTADCVVAGFRPYVGRPLLSSLLLGLYDDDGELRHIGIIQSFTQKRRRELLEELMPLRTSLDGHPWEHGFLPGGGPTGRLAGAAGRWTPGEMALDWVPLSPDRVVEVAYDQLDHERLRHPARFRRWRPDREPTSCMLDQLASAAGDGGSVLALG